MNRVVQAVFIICISLPSLSFSQSARELPAGSMPAQAQAEINWMSFEEAVEKNKTEPKKMFIDVYTNWCGWCKRMDATTFKDSAVVSYMNKHYRAVKFNAETRDTIHFSGYDFIYRDENRANDMAVSLLNHRMSYPTAVYLDEKVAILSPVPGYMTVEQIMPVLKFYGDNIYKTKSWDDYSKEITTAPAAPAQAK